MIFMVTAALSTKNATLLVLKLITLIFGSGIVSLRKFKITAARL